MATSRAKNIANKSFGQWTVLSRAGTEGKPGHLVSTWLCECSCGRQRIVSGHSLKNDRSKSCGLCSPTVSPDDVFGRLTVIELAGRGKHRHLRWKCRCECGRETTVTSTYLTGGDTKSCGCLVKEGVNRNTASPVSFADLYRRYKRGATIRGFVFELDRYLFSRLVTGDCRYCGALPNKLFKLAGQLTKFNGIDRRDPQIGYTNENCVPCCSTCNHTKMALGENEFIEHCRKVAAEADRNGQFLKIRRAV